MFAANICAGASGFAFDFCPYGRCSKNGYRLPLKGSRNYHGFCDRQGIESGLTCHWELQRDVMGTHLKFVGFEYVDVKLRRRLAGQNAVDLERRTGPTGKELRTSQKGGRCKFGMGIPSVIIIVLSDHYLGRKGTHHRF
jgi:hypothetical protein